MNLDKNLRGLSLSEFEKLINACCMEGKRSHDVAKDDFYPNIYWEHNIIGVPINFYYHKDAEIKVRNFKLFGDGWSIHFKGTRSSIDLPVNEYHMVFIPVRWYVFDFQRRGNLGRYKHDLSLLRLTL
jgi:hypothetical protein